MSVLAPVGATNIAHQDCCIGHRLSALNSKIGSISHLYFVIQDLKAAFDTSNDAGTTFSSITKDDLHNLKVVIPPADIITAFEALCNPIFENQMLIGETINTLTAQRD